MSPDLVAGVSVNKRLGESRGAKKKKKKLKRKEEEKRTQDVCYRGIETNQNIRIQSLI